MGPSNRGVGPFPALDGMRGTHMQAPARPPRAPDEARRQFAGSAFPRSVRLAGAAS